MAKTIVGTTSTQIHFSSGSIPFIQNLGPGTINLSRASGAATADGIQLAPDEKYQFPRPIVQGGGRVFVVSDTADTDVRHEAH